MKVSIPIADGYIIREKVEIVKANVPFHIGHDLLDKEHMIVDTINNKLRSPKLRLDLPLRRKLCHIHLGWDHLFKTHFTKAELIKLHIGFPHIMSETLMNLIRLPSPLPADEATKQFFESL